MFANNTVVARISALGGRSSGFDYLRLILSSSVIFVHSFTCCYGSGHDLDVFVPATRPFIHMVLAMFFALSGFLVAGSMERSPSLVSFFGLRILRIVPALGAEITLSALILGPLLTAFGLSEYVSDPQFRHYFLNIIGDVHFTLPGMFLTNPKPNVVNGQLWTIPSELACYAMLGALAVAGALRNRKLLLVVTLAGQALWFCTALTRPATMASIHNGVNPGVLVLCFVCGVTAYVWRDRLPYNGRLFCAALALCIVLGFVPSGALNLAVPATYVTVYLGLANPPRPWIVRSGDYSYGIYLYGFPVQQTLASFPALRHWYLNFPIALTIAFVLAFFSWRLIESPMLRLRRHLPAIEAVFARQGALWPAAVSQSVRFFGNPAMPALLLAVLALGSALLLFDRHDQPGLVLAALTMVLGGLGLARAASREGMRKATA